MQQKVGLMVNLPLILSGFNENLELVSYICVLTFYSVDGVLG